MAVFLKFIGAALLVFAVVLLCYSAVFYAQQYHILHDWTRTEATVIESQVVEHATDDGPLYTTEVHFAFSANGKPVTGDYIFPHASTHRERKDQQVAQYAAGSRHVIVYNPADPSSVRVRPGYNVEFFVVPVFVAGIAAMFAIVGGGLWMLGSFAGKRALRAGA
ncbi:MAG: DUF3592 domain-containing protein [Terriglobales bacterium]